MASKALPLSEVMLDHSWQPRPSPASEARAPARSETPPRTASKLDHLRRADSSTNGKRSSTTLVEQGFATLGEQDSTYTATSLVHSQQAKLDHQLRTRLVHPCGRGYSGKRGLSTRGERDISFEDKARLPMASRFRPPTTSKARPITTSKARPSHTMLWACLSLRAMLDHSWHTRLDHPASEA
eukprot:4310843-Pleurochrysis_carterae.AAC.1